jgi:hypothetical protein
LECFGFFFENSSKVISTRQKTCWFFGEHVHGLGKSEKQVQKSGEVRVSDSMPEHHDAFRCHPEHTVPIVAFHGRTHFVIFHCFHNSGYSPTCILEDLAAFSATLCDFRAVTSRWNTHKSLQLTASAATCEALQCLG